MGRMCPATTAPVPADESPSRDLGAPDFDVLPLSLGSAGDAVTDLQLRLVRLGLTTGDDATAVFGNGTQRAISGFQRQRGLRPDGICGKETWAAVVEAGYSLSDRILYRRTPMMHGDDVADLQRRLSSLGFDPGGVDGIFGDRTTDALEDFQRNMGLVPDGICGPRTINDLKRLAVRSGGDDLVSTVRERLLAASRPATLIGRRVAVGEQGGFATGVAAVCRALSALGAIPIPLHHPDESELALSANRAAADCYVGLRLEPGRAGLRTMYYRGFRYESETSKLLASLMRDAIAKQLELDDASTEGMALPVLRQTQMPAVLIELGAPNIVAMRVVEVAQAIVSSLEQWLMVDWEANSSTT